MIDNNEINSAYELLTLYLKSLKDRNAPYTEDVDSIIYII